MTKNWIVIPPPGISFDAKTGNISLDGVGILATTWIDQEERFHIWLSNLNTIFTPDIQKFKGWGWNGDECHMGDHLWLSDEGGTLEYQKYLHDYSRENGKKISIKIIMIKGEAIPFAKPIVKNKSCWRKMIDTLKEFFSPWPMAARIENLGSTDNLRGGTRCNIS